MMTAHWTAPVSGTYLVESGREPRLLTDDEVAAERPDGGTHLLRLKEGDTLTVSSATLPEGELIETIPVDWT
jgi:hypothetical protein